MFFKFFKYFPLSYSHEILYIGSLDHSLCGVFQRFSKFKFFISISDFENSRLDLENFCLDMKIWT